MKTKFNGLLEFPTPFTYKAMGQVLLEPVDQMIGVVQCHVLGDHTPIVRPSSKGNYHSVSITINATCIEQVEALYEGSGKIDIVHMILQLASPLPGSWSGNSSLLAVICFSPASTYSPRRYRLVSG